VLGLPLNRLHTLAQDNCAISEVELDGASGGHLLRFNSVSGEFDPLSQKGIHILAERSLLPVIRKKYGLSETNDEVDLKVADVAEQRTVLGNLLGLNSDAIQQLVPWKDRVQMLHPPSDNRRGIVVQLNLTASELP